MKKLNQILAEGVYDPGIFKAFFLAGGPGSGKTFVTSSALVLEWNPDFVGVWCFDIMNLL